VIKPLTDMIDIWH